MVKGDPTVVFLLALTRKGSGSNDSKAKAVCPFHGVQKLVIIPSELLLLLLLSTSRSFLSFSYIKKKEKGNLIIRMPEDWRGHQTFL